MLVPIVAVVVSGVLAIGAAERRARRLEAIFKPLTTMLLFAVVGRPEATFARLVAAGIALSVIGDVALLRSGNREFVVGLTAFLLAHVAYAIAFLSVAVWSPHVAAVGLAAFASTTLLWRAIRRGASGLHALTIAYGIVISVMVISASATLGGRLAAAPFAAVGAILFYVSDASLALNRFHRDIPHVAFLTLGVYWLGQLGIAISASSGR
jgi:uncharacterized membrane protein YhhN